MLALVASYLLIRGGRTAELTIALVFIAIVVVLDAADGIVARKYGYTGEIGASSDLYADYIVSNIFWVTFASLGMVSAWIPIIATTRDLLVNWLRQAGLTATKENNVKRSKKLNFEWLTKSRIMRASYAGLKLVSWCGLVLSLILPIRLPMQEIIWLTIIVCIVRSLPVLTTNWRFVILAKYNSNDA